MNSTSRSVLKNRLRPSISENHGIAALSDADKHIYSVGISTGGIAEMRMAMADPDRRIIATTIDDEGAAFARNEIEKAGFSKQIEVKIEDVAKPLPYSDGYFDFIYARLVLHYLPKIALVKALRELFRVLRSEGRLFAVVRSIECPEAKNGAVDLETGMTTYRSADGRSYSRYFHSEKSIQEYIASSGFNVNSIKSYQEHLCIDFQRTQLASQVDVLIEVHASKEN